MIRGESVQAPQQRQRAPSSTPPQQVFLEDLTLVIDVSLMVAFAAAVHLLRKRIITVATLAHALSVAFLVFTAGHYIERHIIGGVDEVEELVRPRGHARVRGGSWFTSWCSAGLMSTAAMLSLAARFWNCKGESDCIVWHAAPIHYPCKMARLRFFAPVFAATVVFVYLCITCRLNALLGGSVLHPTGGGYALAVLTCPGLLSALCLSGCASVWLFSVLVEEQANTRREGGASGRARSRQRESDTDINLAAALRLSRVHGIQRQHTTTRMAAGYKDHVEGSSLLQEQNRQHAHNSLHGRNQGLGSNGNPHICRKPLPSASSLRGLAWDSLQNGSGGTGAGVGGFGGAGAGGVSSARRGFFRKGQPRRGPTHADGASLTSASPYLHSETSALEVVGMGGFDDNHRGVAADDGSSHGPEGELFHGLHLPLSCPLSGRYRGKSDSGSGNGSMAMPSPHRQKIEGKGWASSSSSPSSSSSSSSSSSWGGGGTRRSSRRGIHDRLGDGNSDGNDRSDDDSSHDGGSTDSGSGSGGFTTTLTAPSLPLSPSPRTTFPSPESGHSGVRAAIGKELL